MNAKISGAAMAVALFGFVGIAHASDLKVTPANSTFTATGQGTVMGSAGSYSCSVTLTGTTGKTTGSITGATFSGAAGCENVMPQGLPWDFRAISLKRILLRHFNLVYGGLGRCGPDHVNVGISQGTLKIVQQLPSKEGLCKIEATLVSTPALSITK